MCLTIGCDTHAPYDAMRSDCEAICARFIPLRSFLDEMTMRMRVFGVFLDLDLRKSGRWDLIAVWSRKSERMKRTKGESGR